MSIPIAPSRRVVSSLDKKVSHHQARALSCLLFSSRQTTSVQQNFQRCRSNLLEAAWERIQVGRRRESASRGSAGSGLKRIFSPSPKDMRDERSRGGKYPPAAAVDPKDDPAFLNSRVKPLACGSLREVGARCTRELLTCFTREDAEQVRKRKRK